jgi:hypothetical protein
MRKKAHERAYEAKKRPGGAGPWPGRATHAHVSLMAPMSSVLISN